MENLDYLSADLQAVNAMVHMDLTDIQYPDDSFDVILCSHVLEHISDDRRAMRELCRVLRPGGWAILQVPVDTSRDVTFEDPLVTDPNERARLFGQSDHVRIYGRDYAERLSKAGFTVSVDAFARELGKKAVSLYGLHPNEEIYYCRKQSP